MALGTVGLLVLYFGLPPYLDDRRAVAACLPPDVTLSTVAEYPRMTNTWLVPFNAITVERRLAELGAHAADGKLYDRDGKEILFIFARRHGGARQGQEVEERERQERDRLERLYRVIVLPRHPSEPLLP